MLKDNETNIVMQYIPGVQKMSKRKRRNTTDMYHLLPNAQKTRQFYPTKFQTQLTISKRDGATGDI